MTAKTPHASTDGIRNIVLITLLANATTQNYQMSDRGLYE
jgi:hypothetical protein